MTSAAEPPRRPTRTSKQRTAVAETMAGLSDFRSAQDVHSLMHKRGSTIGLTTVYRALQTLANSGDVDMLLGADGEALYRHCSPAHHHHLLCTSCGKAVEIAMPVVEQWANETGTEHGFTNITHSLEIYGLCAECSLAARG